MSDWFRETPETMRLLEQERAKLAASEAAYARREHHLLGRFWNRVIAWRYR